MTKYIRLEQVFNLSEKACLDLISDLLKETINSFDELGGYQLASSELKLNLEDIKKLGGKIPAKYDPYADAVNFDLLDELVKYGCTFEDVPFKYNSMATKGKSAAFIIEAIKLVEIRSNIDDMSGEVYSHLFKMLLDAGARDVYLEAVIMKKNRPANVLCVLAEEVLLHKISTILFNETTTFGMRYTPVERLVLERTFEKVETVFGQVTLKCGFYDGCLIKCIPEYEECIQLARENKVSFLEIYHSAINQGESKGGKNSRRFDKKYQWLGNNYREKVFNMSI